MAEWKMYKIVLHLLSPLHTGQAKWGNLLIANPYLPARPLWGALTAYLTRLMYTAPSGQNYRNTGMQLQKKIAFTYFYPCLKSNEEYDTYFPWEGTSNDIPHHARFISSYVSTAIQGEQKVAEDASLHEIEFLSPYTLDGNESPVYLMGYIFHFSNSSTRDNLHDTIVEILSNSDHDFWRTLQLGAERSYGWGRIRCECINEQIQNCWGKYTLHLNGDRPALKIAAGQHIPAPLIFHDAVASKINGRAQPLVRRAWGQHPGEQIAFDGMAYAVGSVLRESCKLQISRLGYLEYRDEPPSK